MSRMRSSARCCVSVMFSFLVARGTFGSFAFRRRRISPAAPRPPTTPSASPARTGAARPPPAPAPRPRERPAPPRPRPRPRGPPEPGSQARRRDGPLGAVGRSAAQVSAADPAGASSSSTGACTSSTVASSAVASHRRARRRVRDLVAATSVAVTSTGSPSRAATTGAFMSVMACSGWLTESCIISRSPAGTATARRRRRAARSGSPGSSAGTRRRLPNFLMASGSSPARAR